MVQIVIQFAPFFYAHLNNKNKIYDTIFQNNPTKTPCK